MPSPPKNEFSRRNYPVEEDMRWLRWTLWFEKMGYVLLFSFLVLAMLGLFSHGWLSDHMAVNTQNNLHVKYDRFARQQAEIELTLSVSPNKDLPAEVTFSGDLMENYQIVSLQPQSAHVVSTGKLLTVTLPAAPDGGSVALYLVLQSKSFGHYHHCATLTGSAPVCFTQWIYP